MAIATITETTQFLSFMLGDEVFAVDISKVREVLDYRAITKIPQTPRFVRGVINLRGGVVPVVDMRLKFGMSETERTVNTCIIIVEVTLGKESVVIGALADSVQEVFDLEPGQIEPAPKIGTHLKTEFLTGMGKKDEEFILILDIDRVFSSYDIAAVQEAEEKGAELVIQTEEEVVQEAVEEGAELVMEKEETEAVETEEKAEKKRRKKS
jgi:purine-binding chemotaxis protein CheW